MEAILSRSFFELNYSMLIASSGANIRSKRPANLDAGIRETLRTFYLEFGMQSPEAFLRCVEAWLLEHQAPVAAAAVQAFLAHGDYSADIIAGEDEAREV